ncbi:MAG TPA: DUF4258 domain-containing protein [Niastella sp.]|nr:DUF4258 domain-containing protein [Niastella sp.]
MKQIISTILVLGLVFLASCTENNGGRHQQKSNKNNPADQHKERYRQNPPPPPGKEGDAGDDVINRHPGKLIYTKHARCRMDCRHIDEAEVEEVLAKGRINYRKSEPAGRPDPKYALEGATRDGQQVRIIFAPAKRGMVVITVIDLGTEWSCNCK